LIIVHLIKANVNFYQTFLYRLFSCPHVVIRVLVQVNSSATGKPWRYRVEVLFFRHCWHSGIAIWSVFFGQSVFPYQPDSLFAAAPAGTVSASGRPAIKSLRSVGGTLPAICPISQLVTRSGRCTAPWLARIKRGLRKKNNPEAL